MGVYRAAFGGDWRKFRDILERIGNVPGVRIRTTMPEYMVVIFEADARAVAQKVANVFAKHEGFVYCHETYEKFEPGGSSHR